MTDAWIEANGMPLRPGVKNSGVVKENGVRRLIVSSTPREYALYLLEKAGLSGCYDNGIFRRRSRPAQAASDLYNKMMDGRFAAGGMHYRGRLRQRCQGYAAGVRVFAIPDTACLEQFRDHEAYAIVDSMDDVRRWALEQTAA